MPDGAQPPPLPVRDAIDMADVQESLDYLIQTAEAAARAYAVVEVGENRVRQARATALLASEEKSQDRREADAMLSQGYERALLKHEEAIVLLRTMQNERRYHELRIEVWRSFNANKRQERI